MIARLLGMLAMLGLAWLLRRIFRARPSGGGGSAKVPSRTEGRMVRDRICNTFLPRSVALVETVGNDEHFFCSESCRRAFLTHAGDAKA